MKYLIVGLGNIGEEYRGTRHNIGFRMANALARKMNIDFKEDRYGAIARGRVKNAELVILKPSTYMNLSGHAVRYWMGKENIPIDRILVLVDDLALPFGTIRLKGKGSDAGHNGLKNIAQLTGTTSYPRLRFGIGNDFPQGGQIDYVLGFFNDEQEQSLDELTAQSANIIESFCLQGIERTMNLYN